MPAAVPTYRCNACGTEYVARPESLALCSCGGGLVQLSAVPAASRDAASQLVRAEQELANAEQRVEDWQRRAAMWRARVAHYRTRVEREAAARRPRPSLSTAVVDRGSRVIDLDDER